MLGSYAFASYVDFFAVFFADNALYFDCILLSSVLKKVGFVFLPIARKDAKRALSRTEQANRHSMRVIIYSERNNHLMRAIIYCIVRVMRACKVCV